MPPSSLISYLPSSSFQMISSSPRSCLMISWEDPRHRLLLLTCRLAPSNRGCSPPCRYVTCGTSVRTNSAQPLSSLTWIEAQDTAELEEEERKTPPQVTHQLCTSSPSMCDLTVFVDSLRLSMAERNEAHRLHALFNMTVGTRAHVLFIDTFPYLTNVIL